MCTLFLTCKKGRDEVTISLIKEPSGYILSLDNEWTTSNETEALLFIHGYDHNLVGEYYIYF